MPEVLSYWRSRSSAWTGSRMVFAGVGDGPGDGLAHPPRGVGGELEALAVVELLDGADQAEVALLDEVQQRQARGLYFLAIETTRRRLDSMNRWVAASPSRTWRRIAPLLGGGERLARLQPGARLDAGVDALAERGLVVLREQLMTTDLVQVDPDKVLVGRL